MSQNAPDSCCATGQAVGWPDQNYFARRFKAHYGLNATTYRNRFAVGSASLAVLDDQPGRSR